MIIFWPRLFKRVNDSPVPKIFSSYLSSKVAAVLRPRSRARRMNENGAYGWNEAGSPSVWVRVNSFPAAS